MVIDDSRHGVGVVGGIARVAGKLQQARFLDSDLQVLATGEQQQEHEGFAHAVPTGAGGFWLLAWNDWALREFLTSYRPLRSAHACDNLPHSSRRERASWLSRLTRRCAGTLTARAAEAAISPAKTGAAYQRYP